MRTGIRSNELTRMECRLKSSQSVVLEHVQECLDGGRCERHATGHRETGKSRRQHDTSFMTGTSSRAEQQGYPRSACPAFRPAPSPALLSIPHPTQLTVLPALSSPKNKIFAFLLTGGSEGKLYQHARYSPCDVIRLCSVSKGPAQSTRFFRHAQLEASKHSPRPRLASVSYTQLQMDEKKSMAS